MNTPIGTENDPRAPWNETPNKMREVEVIASVTLTKKFIIRTSNYDITSHGIDENGYPYENIDYSNSNLEEELVNQYWMPDELLKYCGEQAESKTIKNDCSGWTRTDIELVV